MEKTKITPVAMQPLAAGQVWRVAGLNLRVTRVGPMLVDYKLAKPDAVRVANRMGGKATISEYLKKNKAVLIEG
ncbi:MAG: hypothetical protein ABSH48_17330 [Verrucomicrobiota bacterium]